MTTDQVPLTTYVEPKMAAKLRKVAEEQRRSVAAQIALYIERGLAQDGVK